ncbi:MAG: M28 family peptidase [Candidatus Hodarchaeales archaeon]
MRVRNFLVHRFFLYCVLISFLVLLSPTFAVETSLNVTKDPVTNETNVVSYIEDFSTDLQEVIDYDFFADQINSSYFQNIFSHINNFSSFGSRVTGYPGYNLAKDYIQSFFENQNLTNVQALSYPHLVPLDRETKISIDGDNYTAYTLVPNSVHTSKTPLGGVSGRLVYGGSGEYSALNGKEIEGSIIVLEFNSQDNWINAASLGAKGVIYLAPDNTNRYEADTKSIDIPLEFPRVYIENETLVGTIRTLSNQLSHTVTIYSDIAWETIDANNIMGIIPGLEEEIIVLSAYFDSSSVVPALSPGADEACGIATLLELIRILKDNDIVPQKTIMFLALSGHNQAAAGAREFVSENYDLLNLDGGIKLFLSLDLSATTNTIGINPYGYLYKYKLRYTTGNNMYRRLKSVGDLFLQYANEMSSEIRNEYPFSVSSYVNIEDQFEEIAPFTFVGDQEPFIASNVLALSLFSSESSRYRFNTPFDLPDSLVLENLKSQVIFSICALVQLSNDSQLDSYLDLQPKEFSVKPNRHVGYGIISGSCKTYDETSLLLNTVPNALIRITSRDPKTGNSGYYAYYTFTDENGFFQVNGISSSQPDNPLEFTVEAYSFNSGGKLVQANNIGPYGVFFDQSKKLVTREITINPTVFTCGTLGVFDISHPYDRSISTQELSYQVVDPVSRASLPFYGFKNFDSISLIFVPPDSRSSLLGTFSDEILAVYATNSSSDALRGNGFEVGKGEFRNLGISPFVTSKDLHSLTQTYVNWYASHGIYDQDVEEAFQNVSSQLTTINSLIEQYQYSNAILEMNTARQLSFTSLKHARSILNDSTNTALLFACFLIPFSFTLTLFLFDFDSDRKWLGVSCLTYSIAFGFFYLIHPGFQVAPHLVFTLLGLVNVLSIFLIVYVLLHEISGFLKQLRTKTLGSHFITSNQTGVLFVALKTGLLRMKRQKSRTILNFSGIALLTFSLTLFTSTRAQFESNFLEVAIPVSIAILLISNTSLSTVYDSRREISIFTSLGVSPSSILGIFFAEFLMHAIIGSLFGYMGGVTFIRIFSAFGLLSGSFSVNYSSSAVLISLAFSGVGLLVGLIAPLRQSSMISVPSKRRIWRIRSSPEGDGTQWNIFLPFVASTEREAEGMLVFLREFFLIYESESVGGPFFVRSPIVFKNIEGKEKQLITTVNLAPFDMGIIQTIVISAYYDQERGHWKLLIKLTRIEGVLQAWQALVKRFIGIMRQQLLLWKVLPNVEKDQCIDEFRREIQQTDQQ